MPRCVKSWSIFCSATVTSLCSAPVSFASSLIESASEATKSSASSVRWRWPVSTSSGCMRLFGDREERDVGERVVLLHPDAGAADELEDGQEGHDDRDPVEPRTEGEE